jgi:acetyl esterase/lipase
MVRRILTFTLLLIASAGWAQNRGPLELADASVPPGQRIAYGADPLQFGELRLPTSKGPHPLAIVIHGGCWASTLGTVAPRAVAMDNMRPLAAALTEQGIATWNIEYRRLGEPGAGWPETWLDVGRAVDHLRALAPAHRLDLSRVIVVGHSAGGHLAMSVASRARLSPDSPLYQPDPLPLRGVINLGGPVDLGVNIPGYQSGCGDSVITQLVGGTPDAVPARYAAAAATRRVPLGIPQVLVIGEHEGFVPKQFLELHVRAARNAGDRVRLVVLPGMGHFELAMPTTSAWRPIAAEIRTLLESP